LAIADVYVSKCAEYDKKKIKKTILEAFKELGIDFSGYAKNSRILIKPNILSQRKPEDCVTTHPAVVDAVLDILTVDFKEKKFRIVIGESSGTSENRGTERGFATSGIKAVADRYGIECRPFEKSDKIKIDTKDLNESYHLKELTMPKELIDADIIINLPKMKTHVLMDYTGAVKNLFGLVSGNQKTMYHVQAPDKKSFSKVLADIYQYTVKETDRKQRDMITIMDGIIGMEGNGPANGNPKKAELILVSKDGFALDIVAANIMGYDTLNLAFVKELFSRSINPFPIQQKGIPKVKINFRKPVNLTDKIPNFLKKSIMKVMIKDPVISQDRCKRCLVCYNHCPAKTIHIIEDKKKDENGYARHLEIHLDKCIHCFCCHELCPHDAIDLNRKRLFNPFDITRFFRKKK